MRRRRKRDIIIELTALLDVIMILIFMVMTENSKLVDEAQNNLEIVQQTNNEQSEKIEELSAELDKVQETLNEEELGDIFERLEEAERKLEAYQLLDDKIILIDIKLENNLNNSTRYLVFYQVSEPDNKKDIPIRNNADLERAIRELRMFINDCIDDIDTHSDMIYISFSYDVSKIFQKDFERVDKVLKEIAAKGGGENVEYLTNQLASE